MARAPRHPFLDLTLRWEENGKDKWVVSPKLSSRCIL